MPTPFEKIRKVPGNLCQLVRLLWDCAVFLFIRSRRWESRLQDSIDEAATVRSGKLEWESIRRLREYVKLTMALGESLGILRGSPLTRDEEEAFLRLAVFAPFYDDLFDEVVFDEARTFAIMEAPRRIEPESLVEALMVESLVAVYARAPDRPAFDLKCRDLFEAQKQSRLGKCDPLRKGGIAAQLFRLLLRHPTLPGESEAFYRLGCLIQCMDDLFDVGSDQRAGFKTLVTDCNDLSTLCAWYEKETRECLNLFQALDYHPFDKRRFLFRVNFILTRGRVCLERLMRIQNSQGSKFTPAKIPTDQLLVDMEKPSNILRNLALAVGL